MPPGRGRGVADDARVCMNFAARFGIFLNYLTLVWTFLTLVS